MSDPGFMVDARRYANGEGDSGCCGDSDAKSKVCGSDAGTKSGSVGRDDDTNSDCGEDSDDCAKSGIVVVSCGGGDGDGDVSACIRSGSGDCMCGCGYKDSCTGGRGGGWGCGYGGGCNTGDGGSGSDYTESGSRIVGNIIGDCSGDGRGSFGGGFGTSLDVSGQLLIKLQPDPKANDSWVGYIEDPRAHESDDIGALYYVVAVIFIYGLSIVMMIASHVRKNKQDSQLRTYLKEMASLRKSNRREKILNTLTDFANRKEVQDVLQTKEKLRKERKKELKKGKSAKKQDGGDETPVKTPSGVGPNEDSVFLPQGFCPSPSRDDMDRGVKYPRTSDSSSGVPYSVSSECGTPVAGCPLQDTRSPGTPDYQRYNESVAQNKRSPSFHDYRRWKMMETRSPNFEGRAFRFDRPSPQTEHRASFYQPESRSPSLSDFRLSPLIGRSWSPSAHETRAVKCTASKPLGQSEVRFHTVLDHSPSLSIPASIHIVNEDAML